MKRNLGNRLLLLVAVVHLVADSAFAGDMVFCVGVNDHQAIEMMHTGAACPVDGTGSGDRAGVRPADDFPADCNDQLVHAASAEMVSERSDGSDLEIPAGFHSSLVGETDASASFRSRLARHWPPPLPALRDHRTTVLLI